MITESQIEAAVRAAVAGKRIFRPMQSRIDAEILVPAWPAAKICGERTMQADDIKSDTRRAQSAPAFAKDIGVGKAPFGKKFGPAGRVPCGSAAGRCCWPRIGRVTCARCRR